MVSGIRLKNFYADNYEFNDLFYPNLVKKNERKLY